MIILNLNRKLQSAHKISVPSRIDFYSNPAQVAYRDVDGRFKVYAPDAIVMEPVYIHDNFFHHNQHTGNPPNPQDGYGVDVHSGAHALIERNVFDHNRHAIASDGSYGTGYRAYKNLVLEHGGLEKLEKWGFAIWTHTHLFDMHGQNPNTTPAYDGGLAGHDLDIRYNSFGYSSRRVATEYDTGTRVKCALGASIVGGILNLAFNLVSCDDVGLAPAFKLRGTPAMPESAGSCYDEPTACAVVRFNVFAHPNESFSWSTRRNGAVDWSEVKPVVGDNLVGVTDWGKVKTPPGCDFEGRADGTPNTFIATGRTLWYCPGDGKCVTSSESGQATWVYLNTSDKFFYQLAVMPRADSPVCDVVDGNLISVGGTGPWRPR